jgi:N-acetylmuramoyl-L-alanine amidase
MLSPEANAARACVLCFALLSFSGATPAALAAAQYSAARSSAFAHAERMREALEGRPEQQRTRLQYDRVLDAYRAVYHGDPASPKADASIAAVADLLAEEGRVFQDNKALRDAIGQYEFLRHQYPVSRYRFSALLTEGEIYQRDLGDLPQAKAVYLNFLRLYPQNPLGVEARAELKNIRRNEIVSRAPAPSRTSRSTPYRNPTVPESSTTRASTAPSSSTRPRNQTTPAPAIQETNLPAQPSAEDEDSGIVDEPAAATEDKRTMNAPPPPRRGELPLITGIRHWSTQSYTRVAIDLQQEVRYQAARVSNPDRIFFDLYGTRLSPELSGRPVEVTDGFLTRVRAAQTSVSTTRIVLDVNNLTDYSAFFLQNPPRLIIDVHGNPNPAPPRQIASASPPPGIVPLPSTRIPPSTRPSPAVTPRAAPAADTDSGTALTDVPRLSTQPNQVRATRHPTTAPVVASVPGFTPYTPSRPAPRSPKPSPARSADDVPPAEAGAPGIPAPEPAPTSQHAPNSMVRALGLKINRIVIDAGHGGHDSGTLGPGGLEEKDVVLDVALRLGRLLKQRLGADVIYTRSDDTFIPLETRTAIANQAQADLFISIHANSSVDTSARGVEVYYLNFTSSADALEVAARENASSDESIHQLSDLVKKIALQDKINESREFASDVDQSLYAGLDPGNPGLKDRGVKKAPFVVLIGANMPSILAEISFLTNPDDAAELHDPQYRQRIAESLYRGVSRYVSSLNGMRVAQAAGHPSTTE